MAQSPELSGGEGFTFEGNVAAFYLTALLAEASAPGIKDRVVANVSVQQRDFGEQLDDIIVDFKDTNHNNARLSLQVKRSLIISKAKTNTDFREIIRDSWATFRKADFCKYVDRYGAVVGTVTPAKERAMNTLCGWARESLTTKHFEDRFAKDGNSNKDIRTAKSDITSLLNEMSEVVCTQEDVHQFLAHFVLISFPVHSEGVVNTSEAINHIRNCLDPNQSQKAPLVWSKMVQLARESAGKAVNLTGLDWYA
ncbi:hypothetical protein SCOR_27420 [Sulfidibacter corallicola]|uniref:Uncharacterized protein n=1 Tax=Sulfidibacter corallicola TaxID=2818388 RepID=A0A8A4TMD5_SULCO|nr:hypothetical protein [Sulfidibacter corallicola]QTD50713.1 hypothetical protein J3U87_34435 [Sulfidibacter corallicola]